MGFSSGEVILHYLVFFFFLVLEAFLFRSPQYDISLHSKTDLSILLCGLPEHYRAAAGAFPCTERKESTLICLV